jgi:hypothetical protein
MHHIVRPQQGKHAAGGIRFNREFNPGFRQPDSASALQWQETGQEHWIGSRLKNRIGSLAITA